MADSRLVPVNPLETLKVPDDVKIRLAELELELSEGKKLSHPTLSSFTWPVLPQTGHHHRAKSSQFSYITQDFQYRHKDLYLSPLNLWDLDRVHWCVDMSRSHTFGVFPLVHMSHYQFGETADHSSL